MTINQITRLKPVYLPWNEITAGERKTAFEFLQEAVITELNHLKDSERLVLEFQEIPGELLTILENLTEKHPNLAWIINDKNQR